MEAVERLRASLRAAGLDTGELLFVLGSGLGVFAERLQNARAVPFEELDGMPCSSVPGHAGRFVLGTVGGVRVVVQQGRVHLYEGWSPEEVTRAVRALAGLGCGGVVLTNAAGGARADWPAGTLMRLTDHLNLQGRGPLAWGEAGYGCPYDSELGAALDDAAADAGVPLQRGVYAGLLGPSYETPAEVRFLRSVGADAIGMSTVAEAVAAHAAGARVAAVSLVTNPGAGISPTPLSHAEVVEAGREAADGFCRLLTFAVERLRAKLV